MEDREARRGVAQLQQAFADAARQQAEWREEAKEAQARAKKRQMVDEMIAIQSRLFDKSATYTTLVMGAGYAGALTAWSSSAAAFNPRVNGMIGIALGVSLAAFIFFEVFRMVVTALAHARSARMIHSSSPPEEYFKEIIAFEERERKPKRWFTYAWYIVLFFSISGALVAATVMFYNNLAITTDLPQWPAEPLAPLPPSVPPAPNPSPPAAGVSTTPGL